ncbi:MAG: ribonuclease P protein component [Lachnospiraceae bacterium]|nr:ribonuclease P protein component [Lachnospiraceae bacterium]
MKFTESLRKNRDFQTVYKNGRSKANKLFIMYVLENDQPVNRLGISVSKKVGNSVVRHRIKRLALEAYRLHEDMFNSGLNIVVIARPAAKDAAYQEVVSAILHLASIHKIKNNLP